MNANDSTTMATPPKPLPDSQASTLPEPDASPPAKGSNEYYTFLELLGEGSFCKVYKALYKPTQELIAVKVTCSHDMLNFVVVYRLSRRGA